MNTITTERPGARGTRIAQAGPAAGLRARLLATAATLAATLLASPGHAVTIPNLPLQTGTAYPPANVMFILDDSGSMVFESMPADQSSSCGRYSCSYNHLSDTVEDKSYVNNTIYYDPSEDYLAWMQANGTRMTGGTSYDSVYADQSMASGDTIDLSSSSSCETVDFNAADYTNCGGTQTFFVPKTGATSYDDDEDFYRYQIRKVTRSGVTSTRVVRSEWVEGVDGTSSSWNDKDINKKSSRTDSITVPAGATNLVISISGGSGGDADLYVKLGSAPTTSNSDYSSTGAGNSHSVTIATPGAGTWYILTNNASSSSKINNEDISASFDVDVDEGESSAGCESDESKDGWRNCTFATPGSRTEAEEKTNFATWYSYHRTRIKVAKAGASEAFGQLGSSIRVGFDSIWNRNSNSWTYSGSVSTSATPAYKIPVGTDEGLFRGDNRTNWFTQLQNARGYNGTPLHGALQRTGKYFEDTGSSGPWGPGTTGQLSCRQNFAILTTDGYWNSYTGYDDDDIGDADSEDGDKILSEDGKSDIQYKAVTPYIDNFKDSDGDLYSQDDTLADVANYFWKRDLVDDLANDVPTSTADPAYWQHMVTFGVSIGLQGRLDPTEDLQAITNGSKNWGDPTDREDLDRVDDLWHAAVNGHGNFVTATNPTQFVQGLIDALATVAQRLGSASNVTANSTSFQTDTRVYQASYVSGKWTGELAAYEVSAAGISTKDEDGDGIPDPAWEASEGIPDFGDRNIFTWTGAAGATFPTGGQESTLAQPTRANINGGIATGEEVANYIKGDQSKEIQNGGKMRDRDSLLGDIANSSPMFVSESNTIYVGANDGMLHGFDASNGEELFGYVPAGLDFSDLATLSDPQYSPSHRYFVDGPVVVSTDAQTPDANYLVGSLGRGGRGVYALDVTDPKHFGTGDVMWDETGTALGNDMGQVLGEPLIVTLNSVDGHGDKQKAVIVSNGVNSPNGHAVLFVLDLATGDLIAKLDTGVGGDNGLSAPRGADTGSDGYVDYVYAGDLKGNVWKFDLHDTNTANWEVANDGDPMFTATDADGKAQPITAGLAIARNPSTGDIWVFAGTGSFMTSADVSNTDVQSIYGLIDSGAAIAGRDSLVERDIVVVTTSNGQDVRGFESSASMPSDKHGWYIDLDDPSDGERVVSNPRVRGTVLLAASMIPPQENTCDAGGTGYINALDAFTGTSLGSPYFDVNGDGQYNDSDKVADADGNLVAVGSIDLGVGMPTLPTLIDKLLVVGGSKGTLGSILMNPQGGSARRTSWREILRD
jgi:type IV pilus assembly protein PilY1